VGKRTERKKLRRGLAAVEAQRRGLFDDHCRLHRYNNETRGVDHWEYVVPHDSLVYRAWFTHGGPQALTTSLKDSKAFYSQGRYRFVLDVIGQVPRG
jgi:hypothetical protein